MFSSMHCSVHYPFQNSTCFCWRFTKLTFSTMLSDSQHDLLDRVIQKFRHDIESNELNVAISNAQSALHTLLTNLAFVLFDNRKILDSAVDILDDSDNSIRHYRTLNASPPRKMWIVKGSQGNDYICLERFCPCAFYLQQARNRKGRILCKHLLAIKLFVAIKRENVQILDDEEFARAMCACRGASSSDQIRF